MINESKKPRKTYTDADRDAIIRLHQCGLSVEEIVEILHFSRTYIYVIMQAHRACIEQDWSALQKLSLTNKPTVDWAMRVTGADAVFAETFPKEEPVDDSAPAVQPVPEYVTREDFLCLQDTLLTILGTLTQIRDVLK